MRHPWAMTETEVCREKHTNTNETHILCGLYSYETQTWATDETKTRKTYTRHSDMWDTHKDVRDTSETAVRHMSRSAVVCKQYQTFLHSSAWLQLWKPRMSVSDPLTTFSSCCIFLLCLDLYTTWQPVSFISSRGWRSLAHLKHFKWQKNIFKCDNVKTQIKSSSRSNNEVFVQYVFPPHQ